MTRLFSFELYELITGKHMAGKEGFWVEWQKMVSSQEVFGHKVHLVNQKLDFERLVGKKCW